MEEIVYRKSNKNDLLQITEILKIFNLNISNMVEDGFWVASLGLKVLGCARIIEMSDGNIELASVAVIAEYGKKGIGSDIIKKLLSQEKRRPVYLMCRRTNQFFYEKFGFEEIVDDFLPVIYRNKVKVKRSEVKIDGLAMVKKF